MPVIRRWLLCFLSLFVFPADISAQTSSTVTLNRTANGYRGIWYMNQPSGDEYVYKYNVNEYVYNYDFDIKWNNVNEYYNDWEYYNNCYINNIY